jgi:hypothetical protein
MGDHRLDWKVVGVVAVMAASSAGCIGAPDEQQDETETVAVTSALSPVEEPSLALYWAPVLYQDVNKAGGTGLNGRSDYMSAFDYDGDWNGQNNWDNVDDVLIMPKMYYAVTESSSHYFIYYVAYHPRSWIAGGGDEHENDGEGCILLVRKNATFQGKLEAVLTTYHSEIRSFTNSWNVGKGIAAAPTPATLALESWGNHNRPRMFQEQGGHGFAGCTIAPSCGIAGNDSIRYRAAEFSELLWSTPYPIPDATVVDVKYGLIPLMDLFTRRLDRPTFANAQVMAGNDSEFCGQGGSRCCDNAATAIWSHSMGTIPATVNNGLGEDPAKVFREMFSFTGGLTPPTSDYVSNKLIHQKCELGRPMRGSSDPCVQTICATFGACCNNEWTQDCVDRVTAVCGKPCQNCTGASICSEQTGPIGKGCDGKCAASICAVDPYCCTNRWDSICVGEVDSVCHLNCNNLATGGGLPLWCP